jgi:hypothetical protein
VTRRTNIRPALALVMIVVVFGVFLFFMPDLGHLPAAG